MEAAQILIAEGGPAAFTIAEAARRAGVSPGAPYRHFRDAEALLAEVALRGYEKLAAALSRAWAEGQSTPLRGLEAIGRAYLDFARNERAFYAAMFEARLNAEDHAGLLSASERAFAIMREAAEAITLGVPKADRPPPLMVALHIWSMAHGVAALFGRGDNSRRKLPMSPEELLEAGILVYLQGLGLAGSR